MTAYEELRQHAEEDWRAIEQPERPLIKVGLTTCSRAVGADDTLMALRRELTSRQLEADIMITGCWGLCYAEPMVEIARPRRPGILYHQLTADRVPQLIEETIAKGGFAKELALAAVPHEVDGIPALSYLSFVAGQERRLMANCGLIDPENIDHYIARGGYEGLARALQMTDEEVIKEVSESGLWGRGGAAFPTGRKWEFLRQASRPGQGATPKYMICNADEGDPGSFVNRILLESDPHLIIEGMIIGAYATGARYGYIYIRDEYPLAVQRMEKALEQARQRGLLGENILGSGLSYDMEVVRGAGSYVCGEESGLIASLEDARGMPKIRPPYPAQSGVFGKPTNVNNVESYANVPLILRHGARWYANVGSENHKGTKMFSLSGQVRRVGVVEVPLGTPMSEVVLKMGGGVPPGRTLKAIQPGGPLSGLIPASDVDIPLEPDPFRERGMGLGSGGLVLLDNTNCVVDLNLYFQWFAEDESCGRCTTCFAGTRRMVEILNRIATGQGRPADIDLMKLLADTMRYSNCFHAQAAPTAILSSFRFFMDELREHIENRRCPARVCRGLIRYEVAEQTDDLPAAADICPTAAIVKDASAGSSTSLRTGSGQPGEYRIDDKLCIRCHACKELAPEAIEVVDAFGA